MFNEVDCAQSVLGYRFDSFSLFTHLRITLLLHCSVMNAGCCKILLHPRWGSVRPLCSVPFLQMLCLSKATVVVVRQAVYPASIFTTAPAECVLAVLNSLPRVDTNASSTTGSHGSHEDLCSVSESNIS
jgi:cytochrome c oxidase subunit IV